MLPKRQIAQEQLSRCNPGIITTTELPSVPYHYERYNERTISCSRLLFDVSMQQA
jgi:hypothetical protein